MSITAAIRHTALGTFPVGTPLIVIAPERTEFARHLRERNDAAIIMRELNTAAPEDWLEPAIPNLLLEGLDDLDDPVGFLTALHRRAPQARVFALIANSAHLGSLCAFYAGIPLAAAHPLVREDIEPLFQAAKWQPLAIQAFADELIPPTAALPLVASAGGIVVRISEREMLERCRCSALLVIADPA